LLYNRISKKIEKNQGLNPFEEHPQIKVLSFNFTISIGSKELIIFTLKIWSLGG
jgi:hypothetical protein